MSRKNLGTLALVVAALALGASISAQGPSVSDLLEKGIYTEETVGDLKAAIQIYDRIVKRADAGRSHVASALYRLGACHLKTGSRPKATAAFEKLIREYPDQADLVAKARSHLPDSKAAEVSLIPAPWKSGECLRYTVTFNPETAPRQLAGKYLGETTYTVVSKQVNGKPAWRQEQYMGSPKFGIKKYCFVEAERDSFLPLSSVLVHTSIGRAETEYTGGERRMVLNRPGKEPSAEPFVQKLNQAVFDNEQNIFIFRRLPLEMGFKTKVTIAGRPGSVFIAALEVIGREVVEVPAGSFDCFRVALSVAPKSETYWISADPHRYFVKMVSSEAVMELTEITRVASGPRAFRDEKLRLSLRVPAGWDVFPCPGARAPEDGLAQIVSPGMTVWGMLFRRPAKKAESARQCAEKQIAKLGKKIKDYTVREGSFQESKVAGLPAASYVADHTLRGWKLTEYDTCVVAGSESYIFVFVVGREQFESNLDAIQSILDGFKIGN